MQLKEYMFMIMCKRIKKQNDSAGENLKLSSPFGSGTFKNLSGKLLKYTMQQQDRERRILGQYGKEVLLFDSRFEGGNLL